MEATARKPGTGGIFRRLLGVGRRGRYLALLAILVVPSTAVLGLAENHPTQQAGRELTIECPRIVVLKSKRILHLFDGATLIRSYPVDLGFSPAGQKRWALDGRTPVGLFRVVHKNETSPYHRFIGIDYPDTNAVTRGLSSGLISVGAAASILSALQAQGRPDWGTPLGGGIGIHGHRKGYDWTGGCVALADAQVEELYSVLRIGDRIEILP